MYVRSLLATVVVAACLSLGWPSNAMAISSCQILAGPNVGPGDAQFCVTNGPTDLTATFNNGSSSTAGASLSFAGGHISGSASQFDAIGGARFGGEIIQDFRIMGAPSATPLEVLIGLVVGGSINKNCVNCSGEINGRIKIQNTEGPSLRLEASATTSSTNPGAWTYFTQASGPGASASGPIDVDPTHVGAILGFNAQSHIGLVLRMTINLSGSAGINGLDPVGPNAINVDATNTNLFNVFLPAGYTLLPEKAAFLSNPQLLELPHPVPLPGAVWLLAGALGLLGARRRTGIQGQ